MYSNANREENLEILLNLIDNESKITFDDSLMKSSWFSKPKTLGDMVIIQIQAIIQKKIRGIMFDENINSDSPLSRRGKEFLNKIKETNFINRMLELLNSESKTKKDISILILCSLSECRILIVLLLEKQIIKKIINHMNSFKKIKYKNYREHIIISFQFLRRIYIKDLELRKYFIQEGGAQLIKEFLASGDVDIIQESIYNIEDLIYNEEGEYQTISKLMIKETMDILLTLNYDKILYELIADDLRRMIAIFGCKDMIKTLNKDKESSKDDSILR